jgi:hypothetical protein
VIGVGRWPQLEVRQVQKEGDQFGRDMFASGPRGQAGQSRLAAVARDRRSRWELENDAHAGHRWLNAGRKIRGEDPPRKISGAGGNWRAAQRGRAKRNPNGFPPSPEAGIPGLPSPTLCYLDDLLDTRLFGEGFRIRLRVKNKKTLQPISGTFFWMSSSREQAR